jgi:hypothetical protein
MPKRKAVLPGAGDQPPGGSKGTPSKPGLEDPGFLDKISEHLKGAAPTQQIRTHQYSDLGLDGRWQDLCFTDCDPLL